MIKIKLPMSRQRLILGLLIIGGLIFVLMVLAVRTRQPQASTNPPSAWKPGIAPVPVSYPNSSTNFIVSPVCTAPSPGLGDSIGGVNAADDGGSAGPDLVATGTASCGVCDTNAVSTTATKVSLKAQQAGCAFNGRLLVPGANNTLKGMPTATQLHSANGPIVIVCAYWNFKPELIKESNCHNPPGYVPNGPPPTADMVKSWKLDTGKSIAFRSSYVKPDAGGDGAFRFQEMEKIDTGDRDLSPTLLVYVIDPAHDKRGDYLTDPNWKLTKVKQGPFQDPAASTIDPADGSWNTTNSPITVTVDPLNRTNQQLTVYGLMQGVQNSQHYFLAFLRESNLHWNDGQGNFQNTIRVVDLAAQAGYNGIVLDGTKLNDQASGALINHIKSLHLMLIVRVADIGDAAVQALGPQSEVGTCVDRHYVDVKYRTLNPVARFKTLGQYWDAQMRDVQKFQPDGYYLAYDEERVYPSRIEAAKPAAQLMGETAIAADRLVRRYSATAPIFMWNDMFDPEANAHRGDYVWNNCRVPGGFYGSWQLLPKDITVINWTATSNSLGFWQKQGNPQIVISFQDNGAFGFPQDWTHPGFVFREAKRLGVIVKGFMYTTWNANYSRLTSDVNEAKPFFTQ